MFRIAVLCSVLSAAGLASEVRGATWYVDANRGRDEGPGRSPESPLRGLQKACELVEPGDTVILYPGVYQGPIRLSRAGQSGRPIVFRAGGVGRNRVIVTNADLQVRTGKVTWKLEDESLGLYSLPFGYLPGRVLYDEVDLFPYPGLEALKSFLLSEDYPGPRHGFAFDASGGKLYVRLHGSIGARNPERSLGKYGPTDPNEHTMVVAPRVAGGSKGQYLDRPDCANWAISTEGPAHVVLDGFTFEAPAVCGVYVRGSHVTVRNCWFNGCKAGVAGGRATKEDTWPSSDDIVVEYCDYSQFPTYDDCMETILRDADDPRFSKNAYFWWARKGQSNNTGTSPKHSYEIGGLALGVGKHWTLRHNRVHDCFDGLSSGGMKYAQDVEIVANRFERIVDNAIETEDHAAGVRIHDNEFIDVFRPISWQPLEGTPWPGPVYLYRNLIFNTPEGAALWRRSGRPSSWLKAGISSSNWTSRKHMRDVPRDAVTVPGEGFVVFNNTIVLQDAYFLERPGDKKLSIRNFKFFNNIFVTRPVEGGDAPMQGAGFAFENNLYAPPRRIKGPSARTVAGAHGVALDDVEEVGFLDWPNHRFELLPGSPAIGAGKPIAGEKDACPDLGAIPFGAVWNPLVVGPQPGPGAP